MRLVPAAAGTVLERRVAEGQAVQAGDVMFVLALERPLLAGCRASAGAPQPGRAPPQPGRVGAQPAGAGAHASRPRWASRLAALDAELAQLDIESSMQKQRLVLAEQALARLESLLSQQFVSAAQVQAKAEEVLALRAAAQGLVRQRAALQREQAELQGEQRSLPLLASGSAGALERDLSQLEREAAEQDAEQRLVVRAPRAGTVSTLLAEPGQSVSPASALATLVPQGAKLQAELYAPSSAVGFVRPGQPVRLRFEAFAYQKYGHQPGHVLQVSRTPLAASEMAALALPATANGG
jgi:membrane fusion protein